MTMWKTWPPFPTYCEQNLALIPASRPMMFTLFVHAHYWQYPFSFCLTHIHMQPITQGSLLPSYPPYTFLPTSINHVSFSSRHSLEPHKPSVLCKTPLSSCFKVLYLLMFSYLFPADINTPCQKQSLVGTNIFILNIWSRNSADKWSEHLCDEDNF